MDLKLFTVLALYFGISAEAQKKEECSTTYLSFPSTYDWVLENVALERFNVSSADWCQVHCMKDPRCRSFNFQMKTGLHNTGHQCDVNYSTKTKCPGCLESRAGWVYREMRLEKRADSLPILVSPVNVARGKPTHQSSKNYKAASSLAVDGNIDGNFFSNSCSNTRSSETNPWWRVDLGSCYSVTGVTVYNRVDCCSQRLHNMEIRIGNSLSNNGNDNPVAVSGDSLNNTQWARYTFPPLVGRFVNVRLVGPSMTLTLCEVQVFGIRSVCPAN